MIINFEFKNHCSYKGEQFFSMERPESMELGHSSIELQKYNIKLSRVAAIYGANASGKSSFFSALQQLREIVVNDDIRRSWQPFRLKRDYFLSSSQYSLLFTAANATRYQYEVNLNVRGIVSERLSIWDSQKPAILFERDAEKDTLIRPKFGSKFTSKNIEKILQHEAELTPSTSLLHFLGRLREDTTAPAYNFFAYKLFFNDARKYEIEYEKTQSRAIEDEEFRLILSNLISSIDLGIQGVAIDAPSDDVVDFILNNRPGIDRDEFKKNNTRLVFQHTSNDARMSGSYSPKVRESSGTIAAVSVLPKAIQALREGGVCVVDELDSSLHPLLVAQIVEIFNNNETNPYNAQLIFTTHDTSLMEYRAEKKQFDRDQIWFTEKNSYGESQIYSLIDINTPRESENIGTKYLHGRYGATPNISLVEKVKSLMRPKG